MVHQQAISAVQPSRASRLLGSAYKNKGVQERIGAAVFVEGFTVTGLWVWDYINAVGSERPKSRLGCLMLRAYGRTVQGYSVYINRNRNHNNSDIQNKKIPLKP